ncbi:hypothetical protein GCM10018779_19680 [Streptomyces griseocarneus]|nr:hypothetical protein GCM10018779_19680 [Streptomyces griseocarneus]
MAALGGRQETSNGTGTGAFDESVTLGNPSTVRHTAGNTVTDSRPNRARNLIRDGRNQSIASGRGPSARIRASWGAWQHI